MDPAKKAGNKSHRVNKGEGSPWTGTPGPAGALTLASLSPTLRPLTRNMLGPQEAGGQENPRRRKGNGKLTTGFFYSWGALAGTRAEQASSPDGLGEGEAAVPLLFPRGPLQAGRLQPAPMHPQPTGWAILACRLWWAMRCARCLKLLSHSPQPKGRSPVCTRRWSSR